jgi:hypothetical protein
VVALVAAKTRVEIAAGLSCETPHQFRTDE